MCITCMYGLLLLRAQVLYYAKLFCVLAKPPKKLNRIFLCILQNKLHEPLYFREWSGIVREVLHTVSGAQTILHPPGFYALELLAAHCVQKTKTCWCTHDDH